MAQYDAGTSVGRYLLEADAALRTQNALIKGYQQLAKAAAVKPPSFPVPPAPQAPPAATTQQSTLAQQRHATELQRTAQAANRAAVAQQQLATEEQRTAQATARATQAQVQLDAAQQRAAKASQNGGKGPALPRTIDGVSGSAATAVKAFLTIQAAEKAFSLVRVGAQAADAKRALDGLAKSADETGDAVLNGLRTAAQGTIRDSELVKSAATGITLTQGLITKDLPQLVEIARAGARATSQDVGFVFDSLVRGIARGSALIIDNAGITLDAAGAYETYAKKVGTSVDRLTDQQRQQAVLNAVLLRGSDIVKQVGLEGDSAATNIDRAVVSVQNLGEALATKIAPVIGRSAQGLSDILNTGGVAPGAVAAGNAVQGTLVQKAQDYDAYVAGVTKANDDLQASFKGDPLLGFYARARLGLSAVTPEQFAYAQSLIATGTATDEALRKAQQFAPVLESIAKAQDRYRESTVLTKEGLDAFTAKLTTVATSSDQGREVVESLTLAYREKGITLGQLNTALDAFTARQDKSTQAARAEAAEQRRLAGVHQEALPILSEETQKKLDSQIATAKLADEQARLDADSRKAANGLLGAGDQALLLASKYGIAADQAQFLINQQQRLSNSQALADQRAGEHSGGNVRSESEQRGQTAAQKLAADHARQVQDAQNQLDLSRAKTSAQRIAILQREQAQSTDVVEKMRLQAQIENERNSGAKKTTSELGKQLTLQESIYDSLQKQKSAQLSLQEAIIKDRQQDRKDADELAKAQRIQNNPRASAAFKAAAADAAALISVQDQQRALDIAQKNATAGGTIGPGGKLFQSIPGGGGPVPISAPPGPIPTPTGPQTPTGAPQAAASTPRLVTLRLTDNAGRVIADVAGPFILDDMDAGLSRSQAGGGGG